MGKITVFLADSDKAHVYDGDYDANVLPSNALVIIENVPDVTTKSQSGVAKQIRNIYNASAWTQVGVK